MEQAILKQSQRLLPQQVAFLMIWSPDYEVRNNFYLNYALLFPYKKTHFVQHLSHWACWLTISSILHKTFIAQSVAPSPIYFILFSELTDVPFMGFSNITGLLKCLNSLHKKKNEYTSEQTTL